MLKAPEEYINAIIFNAKAEKDISVITRKLISHCSKNIHFIINEQELDLNKIIPILSQSLHDINNPKFKFEIGHKVISFDFKDDVYAIIDDSPKIVLQSISDSTKKKTLNRSEYISREYIPLSNAAITQLGTIRKRISDSKHQFHCKTQCDFYSNKKLLVVGNRNLFLSIPKEYPTCFVFENENGKAEIEYNSPLLPKISILKNINLLDNYLKQEINGSQVVFSTCIFVGSSKFEHSIANIRNYYNRKVFDKAIFIGEKDIKLDLGNNQLPLRWKWTIPEINFIRGKRSIQHNPIIIHNTELEKAITEFYEAIREIESKNTIGLKSIYRFVRRLYYDWNLKEETTIAKLRQIQEEFDIALNQLLIETLGNISPDPDLGVYQQPLSLKFAEIIKAISRNNKTEKLKTYPTKIHQLVLPSFLCNANKTELNQIVKPVQHKVSVGNFQDILLLQNVTTEHQDNPSRNYYSLTANGTKTEILSYSKSDDNNAEHQKVISSIYGCGKIEKLIERLCIAKTEYKLLLYSIEERAFKYHIDKYISTLKREYISQDRFEISGVSFSDNYYQFSNYDELIDALALTKHDHKETDNYIITFADNSKLKLPSSKRVLKIISDEKHLVMVEDLSIGDKVLIYENPNKELLRKIMEWEYSELMRKANEYSMLWRNCLNDAYQNNIMVEPLYEQLKRNHFSVSESTFRNYLNGLVIFPRSFSDLIIIAKTINDPRLSFDFLKNTMKPKIEEYRGMEIECGFKFSDGINHFIITGEADEFISKFLNKREIENIISQLPVKAIKDLELITQNNDD